MLMSEEPSVELEIDLAGQQASVNVKDIPYAKTALADIETTRIEYDQGGRMIIPDRVHILAVRDYERQVTHVFGPDQEDIKRGVAYLQKCNLVLFHNGRGFDELVLAKHYDFRMEDGNSCYDSLVLCRLFYSNVKEEEDFERFRLHAFRKDEDPEKFTGDLIGSHSLEAWGLRLKTPRPKGRYVEEMELRGIDPWNEWNQWMEDYCVQDVYTLEGLWEERLKEHFNRPQNADAIAVEHYLVELMQELKNSGIKFDVEHALKLADELEKRSAEIEAEIQIQFPPRLEPVKWVFKEIPLDEPDLTPEERKELIEVRACDTPEKQARYKELMTQRGPLQKLTPLMWQFNDARKFKKSREIYRPRFNLPEGYLREQWGDVFEPKVSRAVKDREGNILYHAVKESPYTKVELTPLNPSSRPQIIRRLLELGWVPEEFTDSGNPVTSEAELHKLEESFPAAKSIALYLLIQKRLGALKQGEKAWLNLVTSEGFIHPTIHPCSTVTFRGTHADPNISQVPSVRSVKVRDENGRPVYKTDADGKVLLGNDGKPVDKMRPGIGEEGKWGWDCRQCFTVPDGWSMVGADLAGIELRAWAHYLWKYDNGRLADIVLNKDVHEENRIILGFADRRKAKEWLYAMMYGGGDEKLGFIIDPLATPEKQKALGRASRARFMAGMKGYESLNHWLMLGVRRGYLDGLDGRRCPVRKQHAALNTLLQSAGAIISKYWMVNTMDIIEGDLGLKWGYDKDFSLMIYSHDELDFACLPEHKEKVADACVEGARRTQKKLKFLLPIDVGIIHGKNWAECH